MFTQFLTEESVNLASTEEERTILQQRLDKQVQTVVPGFYVRYMKADSNPENSEYKFAVLRQIEVNVEFRRILVAIRDFQFAEQYFMFKYEDERFIWSKSKDMAVDEKFTKAKITLVKNVNVCSRCGGSGLYKAPTGHLTTVDGVKQPICFGCKGAGFTKK